ncbi:5-(carboxyamino)imidazole ribonucleotide synthase [Neolewinella lacunae]|uniref:N5-carboxyaminoimidazole ribonucleotide synthase n=1 Tax=Neolewinella lacunae TaxID=1517758 RepID=A0A923PJ22_9BACT|nr:5-(carboxyamino)imidazole ribonucleotide synthase [Neolewinella lacunae]MBC6994995.1 5-(carboxyamino)imidazole ribonucleotide synthase [Neolewinella lacunae]MDN3633234.1 5-(carboxyamino)imidazole ribonucleotide synthase [Neolewinella lacunae]
MADRKDFPKIGILGGGQLGKMLCQAGADWHLPLYVLDQNHSYPAANYATVFMRGDFSNRADVLEFGRKVDVVTIEIEHIDTAALHQLVAEGVAVYPQPDKIDLIKDKGRQKQFYADHGIATTAFELFAGAEEVRQAVAAGRWAFPFVQKARTGGYDGQGVAVIRDAQDLAEKLLPVPCLLEKLADIDKELAVIVARSPSGEMRVFPTVEMEFHPTANLVEFLICPAAIDGDTNARAAGVARTVADELGIVGLLAVELFLTHDGEILVNEVAPRPHNSGHHTIEACMTSQYEQHLRAILDLPLGPTDLLRPAAMINLLGAEGHAGPAFYDGWADLLRLPEVYPHLYGKAETRPFRKMGHVTALGDTVAVARARATQAREAVRIISHAGK